MRALDIQVVMDCADPARLAEFWAGVLGYVVEPPPPGFTSWEKFAERIGLPPGERDRLAAVVTRIERSRACSSRRSRSPRRARTASMSTSM
jgi:hypothetical protein